MHRPDQGLSLIHICPRLEAVLYNLLECIRMLGVMLLPFLPRSAEKILAQLGICLLYTSRCV